MLADRQHRCIRTHLAGWQRDSDFGFVAEQDGVPLGAVWTRHGVGSDHSPGGVRRIATYATRSPGLKPSRS